MDPGVDYHLQHPGETDQLSESPQQKTTTRPEPGDSIWEPETTLNKQLAVALLTTAPQIAQIRKFTYQYAHNIRNSELSDFWDAIRVYLRTLPAFRDAVESTKKQRTGHKKVALVLQEFAWICVCSSEEGMEGHLRRWSTETC